MNMQLMQCFTRAKPFQLKKSQILSSFFDFQKSFFGFQEKPNMLKEARISKSPNW